MPAAAADGPGPFRSIPAAEADLLPVAGVGGATLHLHRLKGAPTAGPVLLCGHATGMAAGSYLPLLRMLAERLRVYAFDMRGHGGSDCGAGLDAEAAAATVTLDALARDLHAVADRVRDDAGTDAVFYAAHSISGVAALHLGSAPKGTADRHARWRDLILFEPPVMVGPEHPMHEFAKADTIRRAEGTARRRPDWESPALFYDKMKTRGVFQRFRPEMLRAHVNATLRPKPGGGYTLACDPRVESAFFASVPESGVWDRLPDFAMPARFVGGDPDMPDPDAAQARWVTLAAPDIAARVPGSRFTVVAETDHMMMCERPDACRDLIFAMIEEGAGAADGDAAA